MTSRRSAASPSGSSTPQRPPASRPVRESDLAADAVERGQYRHFMLKEIHEQPRAIAQTLEERVAGGRLLDAAFGPAAQACSRGSRPCTSPPAAPAIMPAWSPATLSKQICRIPARVEIASEYRYRNPVVTPDTLFVTISQSGETADTLAALRNAKQAGISVDADHLQRGRKLHGARVGTGAADARGPRDRRRLDQGVHDPARRRSGCWSWRWPSTAVSTRDRERELVLAAAATAGAGRRRRCNWIAHRDPRRSASPTSGMPCFWVAGPLHAIAMEGALKLKEISYIHAEAYAAAELKHGRWRWSMRTCRWSRWRRTTSCWRNSSPICRKCAPAADSCSCSPIPQAGIEKRRWRHGDSDARRRPRRLRRRSSTPCRCSCWPTTWRCSRAPTSISRAIWPRA